MVFSCPAMDCYPSEQRNAARQKSLDVLQRQIHIQSAGHHADFETCPLIGNIDVTLERPFRQALFEIKGHWPAADQRFIRVQLKFRHHSILLITLSFIAQIRNTRNNTYYSLETCNNQSIRGYIFDKIRFWNCSAVILPDHIDLSILFGRHTNLLCKLCAEITGRFISNPFSDLSNRKVGRNQQRLRLPNTPSQ